jgi:penicillin-binding protein 1A
MSQVWIDASTGVKSNGGQAAIYEAFKPGTGPNLITSVIGVDSGTLGTGEAAPPPPAQGVEPPAFIRSLF